MVQVLRADRDDLECHYPGQRSGQARYVFLDLEDEVLWAHYNPEVGNAVPPDVYSGRTKRFWLGCGQSAKEVNDILERVAAIAPRVIQGA